MMKNLKLNTLDLMNVESLNAEGLLFINGGNEVKTTTISFRNTTGDIDASGARIGKTFSDSEVTFSHSPEMLELLGKVLITYLPSKKP